MAEELRVGDDAMPEVQLAARPFISSGKLGKLSEALAKAQGEIEGAKKDAANPYFHSRYADLASVWEACRKPLSKNGLAVIQLPGRNGEGLFVDSILTHSSGEWISSRLFINPVKDDPQGIGSALTYARRYGLQALVGIAPEDDDAEGAMGRQHKREEAAKTARNAPVETKVRKPRNRPPEAGNQFNPPGDDIPGLFNGPKHKELSERLKAEGIGEEDFIAAAKQAKLIPANAKAFRLMSEETAAKFLEDFEVVTNASRIYAEGTKS